MAIENNLLPLAFRALNVLGFEVWFWNGYGPSRCFLSAFGINAKFPRQKFSSISPYFCGENTLAHHRKCIISHKILFSPSFHCENMATGCLIFTVKIRQSFAFGALWRINSDDRAHWKLGFVQKPKNLFRPPIKNYG